MKCSKASEIMSSPVHTLEPEQTLADAARLFGEKGVSGAPVVDPLGRVMGIISESDILASLSLHVEVLRGHRPSFIFFPIGWSEELKGLDPNEISAELGSKKVRDVMTKKVYTVDPDEPIDKVIDAIRDKRVNRLPVARDGKLLGIITREDIIRCLSTRD